jgi:hypothetical protein
MVAIAAREAHNGRGQQAIKFGAPFMRRHAVGMKRVGAAVGFWIVHHDPWVPDCAFLRDLGTGYPICDRHGGEPFVPPIDPVERAECFGYVLLPA